MLFRCRHALRTQIHKHKMTNNAITTHMRGERINLFIRRSTQTDKPRLLSRFSPHYMSEKRGKQRNCGWGLTSDNFRIWRRPLCCVGTSTIMYTSS